MKIAIINTLPIPSGEASVNRLMSYAKGLTELGHKVIILSSGSSNDTSFHITEEGVEYRNCSKDKSVKSLLYALLYICKFILRNRNELKAVVSVTGSPLLIYPLWLTTRIGGIHYLMEKSEYPLCLINKKPTLLNKIHSHFIVNYRYKFCDGMLVMTQPLIDYYKTKAKKTCKMHLMPMSVDMTRFENVPLSPIEGAYIAYCGNMAGNKDGVYNLINAFIKIEKKYPELKLLLIGGSSDPVDFEKLKELAKPHKQIEFYGRASREEIPALLKGAKILALARPSSLQAAGGFPTKLGEYLSTGKPVVVTAVGEIPNYLNNENSFIVEPDNNDLFAYAIDEILSDYDSAIIRAQKGRELANRVFNYKMQAVDFAEFLSQL